MISGKHVLSADQGAEIQTLWHDGPIFTATRRADGLQLAAGGYESRIHVWDTGPDADPKKKRIFALSLPSGKSFHLHGIAWSPDLSRILAWDDLTGFHVWDAKTGGHLLSSTPSGVWTAQWSEDGTRILTSSQNAIRIHDASTGKATRTIRAPGLYLISSHWNRDETKILAGGYNTPLLIHAVERGRPPLAMAESNGVTRAKWSLDDRHILFVQSATQQPSVWQAATGEKVRVLSDSAMTDAAWSPDQSRVALFRHLDQPRLIVCDAATGAVLFEEDLERSVGGVEWSPDGGRFAVWGPRLQIRRGSDAAPIAMIDDWFKLRTARWSPDGRRLATGGDERCLRVWDVARLT